MMSFALLRIIEMKSHCIAAKHCPFQDGFGHGLKTVGMIWSSFLPLIFSGKLRRKGMDLANQSGHGEGH